MLLCGCRKPPPKVVSQPAPKPNTLTILTQPGEVTEYALSPQRHPVWHVKWQGAEVNTVNGAPQLGKLKGVSGELLQQGDPKSFRADEAIADRQSNVLTLTGKVSVYSPRDKANLVCEKVVYLSKDQLLHATGNVTVKSPQYSISGVPEVMSKADFSVIASPDLFGGTNGKT